MKEELPLHTAPSARRPTFRWASIALVLLLFLLKAIPTFTNYLADPHNPDALCPLVEKVDPSKFADNADTIKKILGDEEFRNASRHRLMLAVNIATQVYDDYPDPGLFDSVEEVLKAEPGWKYFLEFHDFLEETYPLVHKHFKLEKPNGFALVYTLEGSNPDKKPLFLTAHQDVVPIQEETLDLWTYPPFDSGFDGKYLYGRGVSDCKNLLTGLLETFELLLSEGNFKPERTIILGFGYDEESHGRGALAISKHLISRYGPNSLFQIIDEGNGGFTNLEGTNFILPATAEKGHVDSIIELYTPGGHSSIPPSHTAIGIISRLIAAVEDVQFESIITNANPVLSCLQCMAEHAVDIDKTLKHDILKAAFDVKANKRILDYLGKDLKTKYLVTTSQAADIIKGGVKSNALPEHVSVLINHRVAVEESCDSTAEKVLGEIKDIADRFDLGIIYEGKEIIKPTKNGYFNYTLDGKLEPAPVTPSNDKIWKLFGGSLRHHYEETIYPGSNETFVFAPFLSTGNTDTRNYWDLSSNIFRYEPTLNGSEASNGIHSVNEHILLDSHYSVISFYYNYVQVVDQVSDDPDVIDF